MNKSKITLCVLAMLIVGCLLLFSICCTDPPTGWGSKSSLSLDETEWAFGPDYPSLMLKDCDDAWNKIHPDLFVIMGSDSIIETEIKIKEAYKAR